MGFFDQIGGMMGGAGQIQQQIQRLAGGKVNFSDPVERSQIQQLLSKVPIEQLQNIFADTSWEATSEVYRQDSSETLGKLGGGGLGTVAGVLIKHIGRVTNLGGLAETVPALRNTDPNRMDVQEVTAVADYARANRPAEFGLAAAELGLQDPGLLQGLLGNKLLSSAMSKLASRFMH